MRICWPKVILLATIVGFTILSVSSLDYPLENGEVQEEYLVVKQMVTDHRFPSVGYSSSFPFLHNKTPIADYIYYPFILVRPTFATFVSLAVGIGIVTIVLTYLTGSALFGEEVGAVAAVVYAFSRNAFFAAYPWAPFLVTPLILLTLFFVTKWRATQRVCYFFLAILAFLAATAVHYVAIILIVPMVLTVVMDKKHIHIALPWALGFIAWAMIVSVLFFGSTVRSSLDLSGGVSLFTVSSMLSYPARLLYSVNLFYQENWAPPSDTLSLWYGGALSLLGFITLIGFLRNKKIGRRDTYPFWLLTGCLATVLVGVAVMTDTGTVGPALIPLFPISVMLVVDLMHAAWKDRLWVIRFFLYAGLLVILVLPTSYDLQQVGKRMDTRYVTQVAEAIQLYLDAHGHRYNTFRIVTYAARPTGVLDSGYPTDFTLIPAIEEQLGIEYGSAVSSVIGGAPDYVVNNSDAVFFVICQGFGIKLTDQSACTAAFAHDYPGFVIRQVVARFPLFTVFAATRDAGFSYVGHNMGLANKATQ